MDVRELLLGRRLANRESGDRKIGAFEAVPAMGLDGLGSCAYGPEAALTILAPLGAVSLAYIGWVMAPIVVLLVILFASYWQTIRAYPNNGGAYVVAKENLGRSASLLAAAALMIDYVLNVAVGISAGVGALVSAVPGLQPHILALCLTILAFVTLLNLRGTLDAGRILALPTYLFVAAFALILGIGLHASWTSGGHPKPVLAPPTLGGAAAGVSLWLLLRAFASGCTAMTGVEAVSNGMSAFREPPVKHGHRTLSTIVAILGILLMGIAYLAGAYGLGAMDQTQPGYQSILSQLAGATVGHGTLYYVAIASVLCVLALSANTSFVDFPRLCRTVAGDGFLPKSFAIAGRRLVFTAGVLYLATMAGLLLVVFDGITDRLIPLFAIGAFLTFTISQAGMVVHWRRAEKQDAAGARRHRAHLCINLVGSAATGGALVVIVLAKFAEGAWIVALVIPLVVLLLRRVRRYYDAIDEEVRDPRPLDMRGVAEPVVLVAIHEWDRLANKAVAFALGISSNVIGVHLSRLEGPDADERLRSLRERWQRDVVAPARDAGATPPRLSILHAEYRSMHEPILKLVRELQEKFGQTQVAILIPQIVQQHWYQYLLHAHRGRQLRRQLLKSGGSQVTVINIPWHLEPQEQAARSRDLWASLSFRGPEPS